MNKKKHFTLVELVIVVVIMGIVATLGVPTYQNAVEAGKARVCQTNLEVLLGALEIYILENDKLPATLGYLPKEYIERSWAKTTEEKGAWRLKLAYFIDNLRKGRFVYAQAVPNYLAEAISLRCPADKNLATLSYRLVSGIGGMSRQNYENELGAIVEETGPRHIYRGLIGQTETIQIGIKRGKETVVRNIAASERARKAFGIGQRKQLTDSLQ